MQPYVSVLGCTKGEQAEFERFEMGMLIPRHEPGNRLLTGSTRSGKSVCEINELVAAALTGKVGIVCLDPHVNSLSYKVLIQLVSRGLASRILFERLSDFDHCLGHRMLQPSKHKNALRRAAANEQTAREFCDLLCRRRGMDLSGSPQTEEFVLPAVMLAIQQPEEVPASDLQFAFQPEHHVFRKLLSRCTDKSVSAHFQKIADGTIKRGQYAAAERLIRGVCGSPGFMARSGTSFDLGRFLDNAGILLIEGGSEGISEDAMKTILGVLSLKTIAHVRSRPKPYPRIILACDEATNANLIGATGHEVRALAECQKMGLDCHILVQQLDFPNSSITTGVMANCVHHSWFWNGSPNVLQVAARDLGDPEYAGRIRALDIGQRYIKDRNGVRFDEVEMLPDPWVFEGLAEAKTQQALDEIIYQRPEYQKKSCPDNSSIGEKETTPSSDSRCSTSSPPDTSIISSPAKRLRTGGSKNSNNKDGSDASEKS